MGYEIPAESADSNDENDLSVSHATGSEMQISPADSTALTKSEERMARLRRPPRLPRKLYLPAALQTGQANAAGDLQRASSSKAVAGTSLKKMLPTQTWKMIYSHKRENDEEVLNIIRYLIRKKNSRSSIKRRLKRLKRLTEEEKKRIDDMISDMFEEYSMEVRRKLNEQWKKYTHPDEISEQLKKPSANSFGYRFYSAYKKAYDYLETCMRARYAEWYSKGVRPEDARTELEKVFPGEEQLVEKYCEEYKTLYKGYSGNLARLKPWLHPGKASETDLKSFVQMQGKASDWWRESKKPDEVFQLLGAPTKDTPEFEAYAGYLESFKATILHVRSRYDQWLARGYRSFDVQMTLLEENMGGEMAEKYSKEYEMLFNLGPAYMKDLKTWLMNKRQPHDVVTELERQRKDGTLTRNLVTVLDKVYSSWWTEYFTLEGWKLTGKTPEDVRGLLNLERLDSSNGGVKLYHDFVYWWMSTHPEKAVEIWKQDKRTPGEVLALLKLGSVNKAKHPLKDEHSVALLKELSSTQKSDSSVASEIIIVLLNRLILLSFSVSKKIIWYNEYADWWIETLFEEHVSEWIATRKKPEEVAVILGLDSPEKMEISIEKMRRCYKQYIKLWNDTQPPSR